MVGWSHHGRLPVAVAWAALDSVSWQLSMSCSQHLTAVKKLDDIWMTYNFIVISNIPIFQWEVREEKESEEKGSADKRYRCAKR